MSWSRLLKILAQVATAWLIAVVIAAVTVILSASLIEAIRQSVH